MAKIKPSFGVTQNTVVNDDARKEVGVVWNRQAQTSNFQFLSIRMELTKEVLRKMLESTEEVVPLNLVAFPNRFKEGQDNRPDYRIYEEKKR